MVFATIGDLVPDVTTTREDLPDVARCKGSAKILDVLAAAVADRQRLPQNPLSVELADVTVRIDAETAQWGREEARASGLPHNEAREVFRDIVTYVLTERAIGRIGRGWLTRSDRDAWERCAATSSPNSPTTTDSRRRWTSCGRRWIRKPFSRSCTRHLSGCVRRARTPRCGGPTECLAVSDVPLLDELADLLGADPAVERAAERKRKAQAQAEAAYARSARPHGRAARITWTTTTTVATDLL